MLRHYFTLPTTVVVGQSYVDALPIAPVASPRTDPTSENGSQEAHVSSGDLEIQVNIPSKNRVRVTLRTPCKALKLDNRSLDVSFQQTGC